MKMTFQSAKLMLNLQNCMTALTEEIVVSAWRVAVKRSHPDTAQQAMDNLDADKAAGINVDDPMRSTHTVDALTNAKLFLLNHLTGDDFACKLCRGVGKVPAKMGLRTCVACNGTGDRR